MSNPVISKTGGILSSTLIVFGEYPVSKESFDSIGARIMAFRKDRGMTQKELAELLEVSQPVVSDYENDMIRIPADVIAEIAELLKVSADELLGLKPLKKGNSIKNRRLYRRVQQIDALPKRDQEALLRTIDAFLTKAS